MFRLVWVTNMRRNFWVPIKITEDYDNRYLRQAVACRLVAVVVWVKGQALKGLKFLRAFKHLI
jgi:hypothetical protein